MAEKALTAVFKGTHIHCVSNRSVDYLVKAMGGTGVSKSQVSRLREDIDARVKALLDARRKTTGPRLARRDLRQSAPQPSHIVSVAVIIAVGVNTDGRRELIGMASAPPRPRPSGPSFCASSGVGACAASSSSSPTPTKASSREADERHLAALPRPHHAQRARARRQEQSPLQKFSSVHAQVHNHFN
jgi:hypothetical protein